VQCAILGLEGAEGVEKSNLNVALNDSDGRAISRGVSLAFPSLGKQKCLSDVAYVRHAVGRSAPFANPRTFEA
jgi:hypothetical protein